jgi:hypothetical protein
MIAATHRPGDDSPEVKQRGDVVQQPLHRRRALRVLSSLAAAAGVAAIGASRPEQASANTASYSDSQTTAVLKGVNSNTGPGVEGDNSNNGPGVYGSNTGNPGAPGVWGNSPNFIGVSGVGDVGCYGKGTDTGIWGEGAVTGVASTNSGWGGYFKGSVIGAIGEITSSTMDRPALLGRNLGSGPGILGTSSGQNSIGIGGGTDIGVGFWGTASSSGVGVLAASVSGTGLWAQSQSYFAGVFSGPVLVQGSLSVTGAKSAAVRNSSGSLVRLYSVESPESWFEDFGSGQLNNGSVTVPLEPGFAGVVKTDKYHVYLTPRGAPKGPLYVDNVGPNGFTVHDSGGASSIAFDYRIVAKRSDIVGARLEHVDEPAALQMPTLPEPHLPKLPAKHLTTGL